MVREHDYKTEVRSSNTAGFILYGFVYNLIKLDMTIYNYFDQIPYTI